MTCSEQGSSSLKDLYLDMDSISGFFIDEKDEEDSHIEGDFVTILHSGQWTVILQEKHIIEYLTAKFVYNSHFKIP